MKSRILRYISSIIKTKALIALPILLLSYDIIYGEAPVFQGELSTIAFNNIDRKIENISTGLVYNGAEKITFFCKGNKTLARNKSLLYSILFDPDSGTVTYFCNGTNEGLSIDYLEYWTIYANFSKVERSIMGIKLSDYSVYEVKTLCDTTKHLGFKSKFVRARLEDKYAGTDMEYFILPEFSITPALNLAMVNGMELNGLPIKFRWTQDSKAFLLGRTKLYKGFEVTEIKEDNNLDNSIFSIPPTIKVKKGNIGNIKGFLKKVNKYLKSTSLHPDLQGEKVFYELNENEWDY